MYVIPECTLLSIATVTLKNPVFIPAIDRFLPFLVSCIAEIALEEGISGRGVRGIFEKILSDAFFELEDSGFHLPPSHHHRCSANISALLLIVYR